MLDLDKILAKHAAWLRGEPKGQQANLRGANLRGVDLRKADLRRADLRETDLREADLREADLRGADLRRASLRWADLRWADLCGAYLYAADLYGVRLDGADLCGADLSGANLYGRIPLYADTARRYVLYVIPEVRGGPRIIAGCRNFAVAEALSHWGPESPYSQPKYVAAIKRWLADSGYALTDVIEAAE